ncbi:MAG TPA: helix-turn-helix transcriptional regulator [Candidatus Baltobacteraceae bacterium]|nr:helix-turn-helix transcriptional regulator [Candidatus Baltobacteraceae bacterium]
MTRKFEAQWHLRKLLALKGIFNTTDLLPLLAERGINISRTQAYRLTAEKPNYVSLDLVVTLCDILDCTAADLIEKVDVRKPVKKVVGDESSGKDPSRARNLKPVRARIKDADKD